VVQVFHMQDAFPVTQPAVSTQSTEGQSKY